MGMITAMLSDPNYVADYTVTRTAAGSVTDGVYTAGGTTSVPIKASKQPLSGRELQTLPTAEHGEERAKLYTETELYSRAPGYESDQVSIAGEMWRVVSVANPVGFGQSYYKAIIARKLVTT